MRSIRKADTFRDNFRASFPTSFFPGKSRILISSPLSGIGPVTTNLGDKIFISENSLFETGKLPPTQILEPPLIYLTVCHD